MARTTRRLSRRAWGSPSTAIRCSPPTRSRAPSAKWISMPQDGVRTIVGTGLFDFGDVDGVGDAVRLQHPQGLAVARDGRVIVCDSYNDSLRWLDRAARRVTTWVRGLHEPGGVAIGARGAYVADTNAHRIVVVDWASSEVHPVEIVMA